MVLLLPVYKAFSIQIKRRRCFCTLEVWKICDGLVLEEIINLFVANHLLVKGIGTGLGALYHFDNLGIGTSVGLSGVERGDCFLCHILLLDFLVNSHALEDGVVLLQLKALRGVLAVLGGDVTAGTGHTTIFVFGALEDNLYAISFYFLCHGLNRLADYFNVLVIAEALGHSSLEGAVETYLIDETKTGGGNFEHNPAVLLYIVELLGEKVGFEGALGATLRVRNIVANHGLLTGDLTDLRHIAMFLL